MGMLLFKEKDKRESLGALRDEICAVIDRSKWCIKLFDKEQVRVRQELIKGNPDVKVRGILELMDEELKDSADKLARLRAKLGITEEEFWDQEI